MRLEFLWVLGVALVGMDGLAIAQDAPASVAPQTRTLYAVPPSAGATRVPSSVMAMNLLKEVPPEYPVEAREKHLSGKVDLRIIVGADGLVKSVNVVSGQEMMRAAAAAAVAQWIYKPYLLNGSPVVVEMVVAVEFRDGLALSGQVMCSPAAHPRVEEAGVAGGHLKYQRKVFYPDGAWANHISGVVSMRATIGVDGLVKSLAVISGPNELRAVSLDGVKQWKFDPKLLNGQPVEVDTTVTCSFNAGR